MPDKAQCNAFDEYLEARLAPHLPDFDYIQQRSEKARIPPIAVSPLQGALLNILVASCGAKRILELGALAGYSTSWLTSALPEDGELITLELHEVCANLARRNLDDAGLGEKVDIRLGMAEKSLDAMIAAGEAPFDFIFMDADKVNYPIYLERVMKLTKPGTLIFLDNMVRDGEILDEEETLPAIRGVRHTFNMIEKMEGLKATAIQTVGSKGYDGFVLLRVEK